MKTKISMELVYDTPTGAISFFKIIDLPFLPVVGMELYLNGPKGEDNHPDVKVTRVFWGELESMVFVETEQLFLRGSEAKKFMRKDIAWAKACGFSVEK